MCNRYTPSSHDDPHFKTWLAINPTNYPPVPWSRIGAYATGPFIQPTGQGEQIGLSVGQWGMIRPGIPTRREYKERVVERDGEQRIVQIALMTNNARDDRVKRAPTFRQAWAKGQRCIIPAAGFDEPNYETGKSAWWEISRADGKPWGIAGLWSEWTDPQTGELVPNYTMLTCDATQHPFMSRFHKPEEKEKRSIVPLEPETWQAWFFGSNDDAWRLLRLPPAETFIGAPVSVTPKNPKPPGSVRKQMQTPPDQGALF